MAHHTKHKPNLEAPEPEPTMTLTEPYIKNHSKHSVSAAAAAATAYSGHHKATLPSKSNQLANAVRSRLQTAAHKVRKPTIDTHFQAKTLHVSADFESSKNRTSQVIEKQRKKTEEEGRHQLPEPKKPSKPAVIVKEKGGHKSVEDEIVAFKRLNSLLLDKDDTDKEPWRSNGELEASRSSGSLVAARGRRRSFGGLQVELADVFASNGVKIVSVDMPPFMQIHAVDCARKTCDSLEKFTCKTLALTLKKEFDGEYGPAWHCIVGTSFGSFVTHSVGGFMYFSIDQKMYILLFKTTVQKAD